MDRIKEFAKYMYEHRTDKTYSFCSSKMTYNLKGNSIVFDCQSLMILESEYKFTSDEWRLLGNELNQLIGENCHDWKTERLEYDTLRAYFTLKEYSEDIYFEKKLHPDFDLQIGKKKIGIEITYLIPEQQRTAGSLANKIVFKGMNPRIERELKKQNLSYVSIGSSYAIAPNENILNLKETNENPAINQISRKMDKYLEIAKTYDEFVILCDARESILITNTANANQILEMVQAKAKEYAMNVAIIFSDENANNYQKIHLVDLAEYKKL